jgi:hypothetical protein
VIVKIGWVGSIVAVEEGIGLAVGVGYGLGNVLGVGSIVMVGVGVSWEQPIIIKASKSKKTF